MSQQYVKVTGFALPGATVLSIATAEFIETLTDQDGNPIGTVKHPVVSSAEFKLGTQQFRMAASQAGKNATGQDVYELRLEEWRSQTTKWLYLAFVIFLMGRDGRPSAPAFINEYPVGADDGLPSFEQRMIDREKNVWSTQYQRTHNVTGIQVFSRIEER